jgi:hypothetical protein
MVSVRTATAEEEQTTHRSRTRRGAGVGAGSSTSVGAGSNRRSRVHLLWRIYGDASSKRAKRPRGFGTVAWRRSGMTFDVIRCVFSILSFFKSRRAVCTRQVLSVCTQHWVSMNSLELLTPIENGISAVTPDLVHLLHMKLLVGARSMRCRLVAVPRNSAKYSGNVGKVGPILSLVSSRRAVRGRSGSSYTARMSYLCRRADGCSCRSA